MPASKRDKVIIAYLPVLHRGYLQFFKSHPEYRKLYIVAPDIIKQIDYLRKDLRALNPAEAVKIVKGSKLFDEVQLLKLDEVKHLNKEHYDIVMPDDDLSEMLLLKLRKARTSLYPVFLRWDRRNVDGLNQANEQSTLSQSSVAKKFLSKASVASQKSSDLWRRVGAVLQTKTGKTFVATNQGEPSAHSPWIEGDPRNIFNRGVAIEMSVFTHAEANLIAEAAKHGTKLEGAKIYVTTFPCPACAKLIAHSGIKTCYFGEGYAVLDGKRVMEDYGVKVVQVEMPKTDKAHPATWVPYKK